MQPQLTDAQKVYNSQKKLIHPAQYALLAVAGLNLLVGEKAGAAELAIIAISFEKMFQGAYNLLNSQELSASMNRYLPNNYSLPTRFGLKLFDGISTVVSTVATAVKSGADAIEHTFNSNNGPQ